VTFASKNALISRRWRGVVAEVEVDRHIARFGQGCRFPA
jgi:hypothetical protein